MKTKEYLNLIVALVNENRELKERIKTLEDARKEVLNYKDFAFKPLRFGQTWEEMKKESHEQAKDFISTIHFPDQIIFGKQKDNEESNKE